MFVNKNVIVLTPLMNTSIREFTICLPKYMSLAIYYQNYRYILYILCLIETILSIHAKVPGAQKLFLWLTISMKKKNFLSPPLFVSCSLQKTFVDSWSTSNNLKTHSQSLEEYRDRCDLRPFRTPLGETVLISSVEEIWRTTITFIW